MTAYNVVFNLTLIGCQWVKKWGDIFVFRHVNENIATKIKRTKKSA